MTSVFSAPEDTASAARTRKGIEESSWTTNTPARTSLELPQVRNLTRPVITWEERASSKKRVGFLPDPGIWFHTTIQAAAKRE